MGDLAILLYHSMKTTELAPTAKNGPAQNANGPQTEKPSSTAKNYTSFHKMESWLPVLYTGNSWEIFTFETILIYPRQTSMKKSIL